MQFIVSTHSPLVFAGVETRDGINSILKMTPSCETPQKLDKDIYGIDCNQTLEEGMGVSKRKPEIQGLFDKAWAAVAAKDIATAKALTAELEQKTAPDQIEFVKLHAIISHIEKIGL